MNQHCVSWDDIPEEVSASGVAKRVLPGAGVSLVMVRVPALTEIIRLQASTGMLRDRVSKRKVKLPLT